MHAYVVAIAVHATYMPHRIARVVIILQQPLFDLCMVRSNVMREYRLYIVIYSYAHIQTNMRIAL